MAFSSIIFDFDGTILDTEWSEYTSIRNEYQRLGLQYPIEQHRLRVGRIDNRPWHEELETVAGQQDDIDSVIERVRSTHLSQIATADLRAGVAEVIQGAENRRLGLAVASSSPHRWLETHLTSHNLYHRFSAVASSDLVEHAKPWPDVFLTAAEMLSVEPGSCLVIEDSQNGLTAAKQAGMTCVVVPNSATEGSDFSAADLVLDSLGDFSFGAFGL